MRPYLLSTPSLGITINVRTHAHAACPPRLSTPSLGITTIEKPKTKYIKRYSFQLPLSGSQICTVAYANYLLYQSFNSLSWDHWKERGIVMGLVTVIILSTPSLGITCG